MSIPLLRFTSRWLAAATLLTSASVLAAAAAGTTPDLDVREQSSLVRSAAGTSGASQQTALDQMRRASPGLTTRMNARTGRPRSLYNLKGSLTDASGLPARQIAEDFLRRNTALFGISDQDLGELRNTRDSLTAHNGVRHQRMIQQVNGIDLFGGELSVNIDRQGRILSVGGEPFANAHAAVNLRAPLMPLANALDIAIAAADVSEVEERRGEGLVYFPVSQSELRLAWQVVVGDRKTSASYRTVVDAADGRVLWRRNGTVEAIATHGLVYDDESPQPNRPFTSSNPATVDRVDRRFHGGAQEFPLGAGTPVFAESNVHYDWWAGGARTSTSSNNVVAQEDRNGDDTGGAQTTATGDDFTRPLDLSLDPSTYTAAATVNLFYWINRIHDVWYRYGFTESFGNYQANNFGLGGVGGDPVIADAQDNRDGGALCNANFNTNATEGNSGRLQMYQCDRKSPERDADLDHGTIIHEYHHGMAERLRSTLHQGSQGGGMGEGGGDFQDILMLSRPGDDANGLYGHSGYFNSSNATTNRRDLYSIRPIGTADAPRFTYGSIGTVSSEVHDVGEIWANALWYARTLLVTRYGFKAGTETVMRLQIDGYKMAPGNPDFIDMRDAILLADNANNGGANRCLLWSAFAHMGIGADASSTGQNDTHPVESFDVPGACLPSIAVSPTSLDFGLVPVNPIGSEIGTRSLTVQICNTGNDRLFVNNALLVSGSPAFSIASPSANGYPFMVGVGACVPLEVRCNPDAAGVITDQIRIDSNDPQRPTFQPVSLSCTGAVPVLDIGPDPLSFGSVAVNPPGGTDNFSDRSLMVRNTGSSALAVTGVAATGGNAAEFGLLPSVPGLPTTVAPGAQLSFTLRFTPTAPGLRSTTIRVDTSAGSLTVAANGTGKALPNLVVTALANPPSVKAPGTSFNVTDTTSNIGLVAATASVTRYLLSLDATRDVGDIALTGTRAVGALTAGANSAGSASVTIPATTPPGSYRLMACADEGHSVVESDESDNCRVAGSISVALPDLIASNVSANRQLGIAGFKVKVTATVTNQGPVAAAASTTRFYLSRDGIKDPTDPLLRDNGSAPTLAPGASHTATLTVRPTTSAPLIGQYFVLACSDDVGAIRESNEINNCAAATKPILVIGGL